MSEKKGEFVDFKKYDSHYLRDALPSDQFEIVSTFVSPEELKLELKVERYYQQEKYPFHFSSLAAVIWIQQMGVVYARWREGVEDKSGFVDLVDLSIRCRDTVRSTEKICMHGTIRKRRAMKKACYTSLILISKKKAILLKLPFFICQFKVKKLPYSPLHKTISLNFCCYMFFGCYSE